MKFTKKYSVEVTVECDDYMISDRKIFEESLEETINTTVGFALDSDETEYVNDTIVKCGNYYEAFLGQYEYPYADVKITVSIVHHSLDEVTE